MSEKRKYDSTVARIAGNIAAGLVREVSQQWGRDGWTPKNVAHESVRIARAIVAEVEHTEPAKVEGDRS